MNNINIIGRLTKDPELKSLGQKNTPCCNFSIAVNDDFKKDTVYFIECQAWNKTGEIISQYVKKGNQVGLTGNLKQDRWDDNEGKKRSKVYINVNNFTFCGSKNDSNNQTQGHVNQNSANENGKTGDVNIQFENLDPNDESDVPF